MLQRAKVSRRLEKEEPSEEEKVEMVSFVYLVIQRHAKLKSIWRGLGQRPEGNRELKPLSPSWLFYQVLFKASDLLTIEDSRPVGRAQKVKGIRVVLGMKAESL